MNDGRDDNRKGPIGPRLVPTGPLRAMGEAFAQGEQARQANQLRRTEPPPETSPLDQVIERERARVYELQNNGRKSLQQRQRKELDAADDRFRAENAQAMHELRVEREVIEARRNAGAVRGWFNRLSGRAAQDEGRLQELNAADEQWRQKQDEQLAELRQRQEQERGELDEAYQHEHDELDRTVEEARRTGRFPEHARLTRDPPERDPGRGQ